MSMEQVAFEAQSRVVNRRRKALKGRRVSALAACMALTGPAWAQSSPDTWPSRPVRMVVPYAAGGATDVLGRLFAARLAETLGQPFVVDNRPGAAGTIGAEMVVRAAPDGHTLAFVPSAYAASLALYKLSWDPTRAVAPIGIVATGPLVLGVHPGVKAGSVRDLIELARAKPGSINFGSAGTGGSLHLAGELFLQLARVDMSHVPYKSEAPALNDLVGGHIQVMFASAIVMLPQARAGKVRGLGVTSAKRSPAAPELPTIGEAVPGYDVAQWFGMWAAAAVRRDTVIRVNQALGRIVRMPEVQERLRADGFEPAQGSPEDFGRTMAEETALWARVVKAGNIRVE
jgi:tripartite-type tricarboxylate transporter receptor subunit TctC